MLRNIILATIVAIVVYLICIFVGGLFAAMNVPIAATVGDFLVRFATVIAILAGLWRYFGAGNPFNRNQ